VGAGKLDHPLERCPAEALTTKLGRNRDVDSAQDVRATLLECPVESAVDPAGKIIEGSVPVNRQGVAPDAALELELEVREVVQAAAIADQCLTVPVEFGRYSVTATRWARTKRAP